MGEAEVKLFQSWAKQVAGAEDPLDFWYEQFASVFTIRAGKVVRGREYMTKDEALAAVAKES
jgi:hypothetical protein